MAVEVPEYKPLEDFVYDSKDKDEGLIAAEQDLNKALSPEPTYGFWNNLLGGDPYFNNETKTWEHNANTWATSGLFGSSVNWLNGRLGNVEDEKNAWVETKAAQFGMANIDNALDAYYRIGDFRNYTEEEANAINDLRRRRQLIYRDLEYVFDRHGKDLDAPIDNNDNSFRTRWGYDAEDADFMDFVAQLGDKPLETLGQFGNEMLKDLPLGGIARLVQQGLKGGKLWTAIANKVNNLQPRSLQNLAKVGGYTTAGAAIGAGYEAAYTALDEGKIKYDQVETGAAFGGAFGVLGSLGILARGREAIPKETPKTTKPKENSPADITNKLVDADYKQKQTQDVLDVLKDNQQLLFKDFKEGVDYRVISSKDAVKEGLIDKNHRVAKGEVGATNKYTPDRDIKNNIIIDKKGMDATFDRLQDVLQNQEGYGWKTLQSISAKELALLQNRDAFDLFTLAHEQSHAIQNKGNPSNVYPSHPNDRINPQTKQVTGSVVKERQANRMAMNELNRIYEEKAFAAKSKAALQADLDAKAYADKNGIDTPVDWYNDSAVRKLKLEKTDIEPEARPTRFTKAIDYLERYRVPAAAATGTAAYFVSDQKEGDPLKNAALVAISTALAPKGYRILSKQWMSQIELKVRRAAAEDVHTTERQVAQLEYQSQMIMDDAYRYFQPKFGDNWSYLFNETVEVMRDSGTKRDAIARAKISGKYPELKQVFDDNEAFGKVQDWHTWTKFLFKAGSEGDNPIFRVKVDKKSKTQRMNFVEGYLTHVVRGKIDPKTGKRKRITEDELQDAILEFDKSLQRQGIEFTKKLNTPYALPRALEGSIEDLKKMGYDMVDDPRDLGMIYTNSLARTIANRKLLLNFTELDLGSYKGTPFKSMYKKQDFELAVKRGEIPAEDVMNFKPFDHYTMKDYMVHANVKDILEDYYTISTKGSMWNALNATLNLNNALKRMNVAASMFHGQALLMSAIYVMGVSNTAKVLLQPLKDTKFAQKTPVIRSWAKNKSELKPQLSRRLRKELNSKEGDIDAGQFTLGTREMNELILRAKGADLKVGNTKNIELVNVGKQALDNYFTKLMGPTLGEKFNKAYGVLDYATWEFMHDRFKVAAWLRETEIQMAKGLDQVSAERNAAIFINDAFGSLDWDGFVERLYSYAERNPNTFRGNVASKMPKILSNKYRKYLNFLAFAPDWTVANARIVARTFTQAPKASAAYYKKLFNKTKNLTKQEKEIIASWEAYSMYTARAGMYTSAMWYLWMNAFSDKEPTWDRFFDFWFGEKNSGKIDLGGGQYQVISKQIGEPWHWIVHFEHTFLNKMSVLPKTVMELLMNKQWMSIKDGQLKGPPLVEKDGTRHYGEWLFGKMAPISMQNLFRDDLTWADRAKRTGFGFFGLPIYGAGSKAMEKVDYKPLKQRE